VAAGGQEFLDDAHRAADLHRVVDVLFRHADAPLAKCLEYV
jgi:hypothetical protein